MGILYRKGECRSLQPRLRPMDKEFRSWCKTVTDCVRFAPDRKAIAQELEVHYIDHVRDLERLGFDMKEAESRALQVMGDAEEVGRAMDKVHKPWLGRLWQVSRWLVAIACLTVLINLLGYGWPDFRQAAFPVERPKEYLLENAK